jgi:hypothetical protein
MTGEPLRTIDNLHGKIWRRAVPKQELEDYQSRFAVISTRLVAGRTVIHVFSDERPDLTFEPVTTSLEDVYFSTLQKTQSEVFAA